MLNKLIKNNSIVFIFLVLFNFSISPAYAVHGSQSHQPSSNTDTDNTDTEIERQKADLAQKPVRDLSQYPEVMEFLKNHKVYVSMTSSPKRFAFIHHVIDTLDLTHVEKILVNLPKVYGRTQETYDETTLQALSQYPMVEILRPEKDLGPITKLVPGAEYVQQRDPLSILITVDDDIGYTKGMVNEVIYQMVKNFGASVSGSGQDRSFWNIKGAFPNTSIDCNPETEARCTRIFHDLANQAEFMAYRVKTLSIKAKNLIARSPDYLTTQIAHALNLDLFSKARKNIFKIAQFVARNSKDPIDPSKIEDQTANADIVEGFATIGYLAGSVDTELMRKFSDPDLMKRVAGSELPTAAKSCFASDDLVISFTLALSNIERKAIKSGYLDLNLDRDSAIREFAYGLGEDALHKGAGLDHVRGINVNEIKYKNCYQLLMKITFDELNFRFKYRSEILDYLNSFEANSSGFDT